MLDEPALKRCRLLTKIRPNGEHDSDQADADAFRERTVQRNGSAKPCLTHSQTTSAGQKAISK